MTSRVAIVGACEGVNQSQRARENCRAHFWIRLVDDFTNKVLCLVFL